MTDQPLEVDISDEQADDAALDELPDEAPEPEVDNEPEPEVDLEQQAKEEAVRLRENASGSTQSEKIDNALEQAQESLNQTVQQMRSVAQQKQESEQRIERLEMTKERVETQPGNHQVLQTLAGGVSLEVPLKGDEGVYDRQDLVDEIDETIEALEGQLESLGETEQKLEMALRKTRGAADHLQQAKEIIGDDVTHSHEFEMSDGQMPR